MVSDFFKEMEDKIGNQLLLQNDLIQEITDRLGKDKTVIERAVYGACVATGVRVMEATVLVHEFLAALEEMELSEEAKEQGND